LIFLRCFSDQALADTVHDKFLALGDTLTTNTKYQGKSLEIEDVLDITLSDGRKLVSMFIVIAQRAAFEFAVSIVGKNPKIGLLLPANSRYCTR
jgi:hypothetical protein